MNAEFIKCDGSCGQFFHSKCAALNKTTLNAITSNANVHWFCHHCNNGNLTVANSILDLKESMSEMSKALSTNLGNFTEGFKTFAEMLIGNTANNSQFRSQTTNSRIISSPAVHRTSSNQKRRREELVSDPEPRKKIILGANEQNRTIAAAVIDAPIGERRKSVVVSNVNKSVTAEYLADYLANELNAAKEDFRVTRLHSSRTNFTSLQYRISTPEAHYDRLMHPNTWPINIKIRDFVFKRQDRGVSERHFLEKRLSTPAPTDQSPIPENANLNSQLNVMSNEGGAEIEMDDKE